MHTNRGSEGRLFGRREMLSLISAAGGACMVPVLGESAFAAMGQAPGASTPAFPEGAVIRTLLGDMTPDQFAGGTVLFHEHLSMKYPLGAEQHYTDDVAMMVEEVRAAAQDGISCIVDGGHPDMERDLGALRRIATETGVPIVASGGYYMQTSYPPDIAAKSADEIAGMLVEQSKEQGLGALGEIGQAGGVLTADETKVFQSVARAHGRTGLPIFTHNAYFGRFENPPVPRESALRQLDVLEEAGAAPEDIAIGHLCCLEDPKAEVAQELARRGAFVGFDRVTIRIVPDAERVTMVMAMVDAGYADSVLLSSDFSSENSLKSRGGAGLAQTKTVFAPMLLEAGMPEATLRRILEDNPRRFLSFVPK
jgi:phosphotriesterase-related protein